MNQTKGTIERIASVWEGPMLYMRRSSAAVPELVP